MLLGFKRRFAPFVEEGSKTHSIRAKRKIRPKVGETCHCYVDPRQKTMRLLGRFPCSRVEDIRIDLYGHPSIPLIVWINNYPLQPEEADLFFKRDGFRDRTGETFQHMHQAAEFWAGRHFPFEGDVIHWRFAKPISSAPQLQGGAGRKASRFSELMGTAMQEADEAAERYLSGETLT